MNLFARIRRRFSPMLFGLVLAGCMSRSHLPDKVSNLLDDKTTTARVEEALQNIGGNDFSRIVTATTNSVVTLRGTVPSVEARNRAAAIARGLDRVKEVRDEMEVRSAGPDR